MPDDLTLTAADHAMINALILLSAGGLLDPEARSLARAALREVMHRVNRRHPWTQPLAVLADAIVRGDDPTPYHLAHAVKDFARWRLGGALARDRDRQDLTAPQPDLFQKETA